MTWNNQGEGEIVNVEKKRGTDTKTNSDTNPSQSLFLIELAFDKVEHIKNPLLPWEFALKWNSVSLLLTVTLSFAFYLESHSKEVFVSCGSLDYELHSIQN